MSTVRDEITSGTLFRRIPNDHAHWVFEEARPTKYNFTPETSDDFLSMHRSDMIHPDAIFAMFPGFGLLEIDIEVLLEFGLRVTYQPEEGRDHVAVWGLKGNKNPLRRELCKRVLRLWEPGTQALVLPKGR